MIFAVDIGGTRLKAARVASDGSIVAWRAIPSPATLDAFQQQARAMVAELGEGAQAAGIGCKGNIDPVSTYVKSLPGTMHYLEGQTLCELFGIHPAFADNDARVALFGESTFGAARGARDVLLLTLGTGVGGGVLMDGVALRGVTGAAGHLGHYTVNPNGELCICGNRGCLETIFSAKAIEAALHSALSRGVATRLTAAATCADVFSNADDPLCHAILEPRIEALAGALAGMSFAFDPEVIVIGGQVAEAGDVLFGPLRRQHTARTMPFLRREIPIRKAEVSDGVVGAAALAVRGLREAGARLA
ncbi:MAG: ROK family protein [Bryobacterales bacterium]|nr:ROK family protein [Bryobacterales bacterium]